MNAVLEESSGQRWFRLPVSGLDVRFFLKGPMLGEGHGKAQTSRTALSPLLGPEPSYLMAPKQVHGATVLENIPENAPPVYEAEADGILFDAGYAADLEIEASLRFADCAPVVVAPSREWVERNGTPWVLMMHSGYKGTVQNIAAAGLKKALARYGESALDGAWAWIGPCIGGENYPRDIEEWTLKGLDSFREANVKRAGKTGKAKKAGENGEKIFFDIAGELKLQLIDAGITEERIFLSGIDTCERADLCYSYRCGEKTERMFLWAGGKRE